MSIIACSVVECEAPKRTRGYCDRHYNLWRRNGFPGYVKTKKPCTVEGCLNEHRAKGFCMMHYLRSKRSPNGVGAAARRHISGQTTCRHADCVEPALSLHLCSKHYWRLKDFGPEGLDRISIFDSEHTISYSGAHRRIYRLRGPAASLQCTDCPKPAQQWSYDHSDPGELMSDEGLPYSIDVERYQPRCTSCHTIFDSQHARS